MTKNGIIGLSAGAIVVLGGLTFYTHSAFSSQIEQAIAQNSNDKYTLSIESKEDGLLSSKVQYKLTLYKNVASQMGTSLPADVDFYVNHHYSSYPLLVHSQFTLDFTKGAGKSFVDALKVESIEHMATLSTNLLTHSNALNFEIRPAVLEDHAENVVTIGNLKASFDGDLAFSQGDFAFAFSEMAAEMKQGGRFQMKSLTSAGEIDSHSGLTFTRNSVSALEEASFNNEAVLESWSVNHLTAISSSKGFDTDVISGETKLAVQSVKVKNALLDYLVTDTELELLIQNLDKASFIELNRISSSAPQLPEILASTEGIINRGFDGKITKLKTTVNDVALDSSGTFEFPAYAGEMNQQMIMMHALQNFSLDYTANLSNNYAEVFPQYAPMIDGLTAQGFAAKDQDGNVSTTIKIKDMAITANDKRIR
ncbi:hypothetical protein ACMAZF_10160 [Psychrobium sp. nBUS_13]|uniref:hypothetical protein n=1 Tax=Psychrobium sp. nBUS_13 TaxID=3395319 RepID=UPI003EBFC7E8